MKTSSLIRDVRMSSYLKHSIQQTQFEAQCPEDPVWSTVFRRPNLKHSVQHTQFEAQCPAYPIWSTVSSRPNLKHSVQQTQFEAQCPADPIWSTVSSRPNLKQCPADPISFLNTAVGFWLLRLFFTSRAEANIISRGRKNSIPLTHLTPNDL
jgi:hypothetical protein